MMERESSTQSEPWQVMGKGQPKSYIVNFCQMFVVYIIIITSVVNLSLQKGKNELWITLLSSVIDSVPVQYSNQRRHKRGSTEKCHDRHGVSVFTVF